ncbi:hypothetical protein ACFOSC_09945 [Streptantibioticus rubrisoli]|uniref:Integral membrane protein n=1 Tax=Streptantibioticus rubrisoli TaxID=1387313 RepID=A0ABT1P8B1_9ACTN|nr:hypothetical protein [Streptantibioticus rubrisoli]MCQ4041026.1 hypothetical protein [Streptantibioticus rubrisoli]
MNAPSPRPAAISDEALNHPRSQAAFRSAKRLVGAYLGISVLTLVAIVLLRGDTSVVNQAVWVRGSVVVASALLTYILATRMTRGSHGAYRRLRIISAVMTVAIAAIVTLPGAFPLWMKIEQGLCGLCLLGVVLIVNGSHLRSLFATK